jgi:hypothetical protein
LDGFGGGGDEGVEGEGFDGEGGHDGAGGDGVFEGGDVVLVFGGEEAEEAAGEGVAGAGGIDEFGGGIGGEGEEVIADGGEAAVLAFFEEDDAGAGGFDHGLEVADGGDHVGFVREEAGFKVVEDDAVEVLVGGEGFGAVLLDPEVAGVRDGEAGGFDLVEEVELEVGVGGREEDDFGILELRRYARGGFDEDVEIDVEGGGLVHGGVVGAGPAEGFRAFAAFEAGDVDVGVGEGFFEFGGEVFADDGDEADLGEGGGGPGEVDGGAADDVVGMAGGGGDVVNADGTGNEERHAASVVKEARVGRSNGP